MKNISKYRKWMSASLLMLMLLFMPQRVWAETVQIGTRTEMQAFANRVNAGETQLNAELTADIEDAIDFMIASKAAPYEGTFDGKGHSIQVSITASTTNYVGLFRALSGATVRNLTVSGSIQGQNHVGGIAGYSQTPAGKESLLSNSKVSANVTGSERVGGLVGTMTGVLMSDFSTSTYVTGSTTVDSCTYSAKVKGVRYVGGIVGYVLEKNTTAQPNVIISNSIFSGSIDATESKTTGSIAGYMNCSEVSTGTIGTLAIIRSCVSPDNCIYPLVGYAGYVTIEKACEAEVSTQGQTQKFETLSEAWTYAASKSEATVRLLMDVTTGTLNLNDENCGTRSPKITLDLNDHVLSTTANYLINASADNHLYIVDNAPTKSKKYHNQGVIDSLATAYVEGGVIVGAKETAIYYQTGTLLEMRNVNLIGNGTSTQMGSGGAISSSGAPMNLYNCTFCYNKSGYGGALITKGIALVKDCRFTHNEALYGGAIHSTSILTVIETEITQNSATQKAGGISLGENSCLAAGTMITMADGSQKKIEEIQPGDLVRTFDHESGKVSASPVFLAFRGKSLTQSATLLFESGNTLDIVGEHAFLSESTRKYESLTAESAVCYIGERYYNLNTGSWDKLVGVRSNSEPTYAYSLTTAFQINCVANGLLNVGSDYSFLLNIYELDANLKADAEQLAADIARYGLDDVSNYPQLAEQQLLFECVNAKYLHIAVGKKLVSGNFILRMISSVSFSNGTASASTAQSASRLRKTSVQPEPTYATYSAGVGEGCLIVGRNVVIKNNTLNGAASNVYLYDGETSTLGSTPDTRFRLLPDHAGSEIGVTTMSDLRVITDSLNVTAADTAIFFSDSNEKEVQYENGVIRISLVIYELGFSKTTDITQVYVNGVAQEVTNPMQVHKSASIRVVANNKDSLNILFGGWYNADRTKLLGKEREYAFVIAQDMTLDYKYIALNRDAEGNYSTTEAAYQDEPYFCPVDYAADQVTVAREFKVGIPATFMAPFEVNVNKISGADFYYFRGIELDAELGKTVATMVKVEGADAQFKAYTPYIIIASSKNITVQGAVTFKESETASLTTSDENGWTFTALNNLKHWNSGDAELGKAYAFAGSQQTNEEGVAVSAGDFVTLSAGAYGKAGRCYLSKAGELTWNSSSVRRRLTAVALPASITVRFISEVATGIATLNAETGEISEVEWFDLSGRSIEKPVKGNMYIKNNKVILVK